MAYERIFKESSLSRIWKHVTDPKNSFGVVSSYRQDLYSIEDILQVVESVFEL